MTSPKLSPEQRDTLSHVARPLRTVGRPDSLTAQHVEVAIVLHAMLGDSAATEYLHKHRVPAHIAARVLHPAGRRRGCHDEQGVRLERC